MISFSNEELDQAPLLTAGATITCPHCGGDHEIEAGTENGEPSDLLLFFKCGEKAYLAGVAGKNVMSRFAGAK